MMKLNYVKGNCHPPPGGAEATFSVFSFSLKSHLLICRKKVKMFLGFDTEIPGLGS